MDAIVESAYYLFLRSCHNAVRVQGFERLLTSLIRDAQRKTRSSLQKLARSFCTTRRNFLRTVTGLKPKLLPTSTVCQSTSGNDAPSLQYAAQ